MELVIVTDKVNRGGYRVIPQGVDLSGYEKNPVLLLHHDNQKLPIGRLENIRVEETRIVATPVFDMGDPMGKQAASKFENGFLSAASVGYDPIEYSDSLDLVLPGQMFSTVTKWDLMEVSMVSIPMDKDATILRQSYHHDHVDVIPRLKQSNPKSKPMKQDFAAIAATLNLNPEATQAEIIQSINGLNAKNQVLETENENFKAQAIEGLMAKGEAKGLVTETNKQSYEALAKQNFEGVAELINNTPEVETEGNQGELTETLAQKMARKGLKQSASADNTQQSEDRSTWGFDDWSKKDPKGLKQMKQTDEAKYKQLVAARKTNKK